jgi:hypothetical protein
MNPPYKDSRLFWAARHLLWHFPDSAEENEARQPLQLCLLPPECLIPNPFASEPMLIEYAASLSAVN